MVHRCAVCDTPTEQRCSGCHLQYYCSKPHSTQDWKRHKAMCKTLQDTSLSTVPIPLSTPTPAANMGGNTLQAIVFPANEDMPRIITIEWEWVQEEYDPVPRQQTHIRHLFHKRAAVREKPIYYHPYQSGIALPDNRSVVAIINDDFLVDGSPLNRSIFNLTQGKAGHHWSDNVLALRQRPEDSDSRYGSAVLEEDLDVLKDYFLTYNTVNPQKHNPCIFPKFITLAV